MGTLLMVPVDETGALVDASTPTLIQNALSETVSDVCLFSHGWWTNADRSMIDYSRFLLGFNRTLARVGKPTGLTLPTDAVAIGLHWPSMYSEDPNAFANIFQVGSFHTMEVRTYAVGRGGGKQIVAAVWQWAVDHPDVQFRMYLVGHSFGCRVACYALVSAMRDELALYTAFMRRYPPVPVRLALLEAAMPHDVFALGHPYATLQSYGPALRILATRSTLDTPLVTSRYYPEAEAVQPADQFDLSQPQAPGSILTSRPPIPALGGVGPDPSTLGAYNNNNQSLHYLPVGVGFQCTNVVWGADRLLVADLTPLHEAHRQQDQVRPSSGPVPPGRPAHPTDPGGYHSDIYCDEVYQLLIGALFS